MSNIADYYRDQQRKRHEQMESGSEATVMLGQVSGPIAELRDNILSRMISAYRGLSGVPFEFYFGCAAELTALDNLVRELEVRQRRGDIAAEKELNDGE